MLKKSIISSLIILSFPLFAKDFTIYQNGIGMLSESGYLKDNPDFSLNDNSIYMKNTINTVNENTLTFKVNNNFAQFINYSHRNIDLYSLLKNAVGEKVSYFRNDNSNTEEVAQIYDVIGNQIFLTVNNKILLANINEISIPEDIIKKTEMNLIASFNNRLNKDDSYQYSYLVNNFNWQPMYNFEWKNDNLNLTLYGNISNNSNTDLKDLNLTLVSTPVLNQEPIQYLARKSMIMSEAMPSTPNSVSDFNMEDLSLFKLDKKINLVKNSSSNVKIKSFENINYEKVNQFDLYFYNIDYQGKDISPTNTILHIDKEMNKDLTSTLLPTGDYYIYKEENENKVLYYKGLFSSLKNDDISLKIPTNKTVYLKDYVKSNNDFNLLSKELISNNRFVYQYSLKTNQRLKNTGDKVELFKILLDGNNLVKIEDYDKSYNVVKNDKTGKFEFIIYLNPNEEKELFIKRIIKTNNVIK